MSKEAIYDEQINPLMARILEICKEHKIAMLADFFFSDAEDLHCTSALLPKDFSPSEEQLAAYKILTTTKGFAMAITEETKPNGNKKVTMRRIT